MTIPDFAKKLKSENPQIDVTHEEMEVILKVIDRWSRGILHIVLAFFPKPKAVNT